MIATLRGLREDVSKLSRDVETLRSEVHKKITQGRFKAYWIGVVLVDFCGDVIHLGCHILMLKARGF